MPQSPRKYTYLPKKIHDRVQERAEKNCRSLARELQTLVEEGLQQKEAEERALAQLLAR